MCTVQWDAHWSRILLKIQFTLVTFENTFWGYYTEANLKLPKRNGNKNLLIILKNGYVADDFLVHFLTLIGMGSENKKNAHL